MPFHSIGPVHSPLRATMSAGSSTARPPDRKFAQCTAPTVWPSRVGTSPAALVPAKCCAAWLGPNTAIRLFAGIRRLRVASFVSSARSVIPPCAPDCLAVMVQASAIRLDAVVPVARMNRARTAMYDASGRLR